MINISSWRPYWNSKWRPNGLSDISNQFTVELSMSKYHCLPNFSATGHLEPKIVMFYVSSWQPYWNSRWRPIQWSDLLDPTIFELSMSKYLCTVCKIPHFLPDVNISTNFCHISAPLYVLNKYNGNYWLNYAFSALTLSVGGRKGIQPVQRLWLSVWGVVQICIWPRWCHCHSLFLSPVNPDWFYIPGFTFLVSAHLVSPDKVQGAVKRL